MASENDRLQSLRQKLDLTRDELDAELKKRADRDKELVASVEKQVEDLRSEIDSILKSRAGEKHVASTLTHIKTSCWLQHNKGFLAVSMWYASRLGMCALPSDTCNCSESCT